MISLEQEEHAVCNKEVELDAKTKGYYCAKCDFIVLEPCLMCLKGRSSYHEVSLEDAKNTLALRDKILEYIDHQCKHPGRISNG